MSNESKNHAVVSPEEDPGLYRMLKELITKHHDHLAEARICLVWRFGWKADRHGKLVLGKCKKASDFDLAFIEYDFVILFNAEAWKTLDWKQRTALMDHELCHAWGEADEEDGDTWKFSIRKHDIEEFRDIVERHGCYKADLEAFVKAALQGTSPTLFDAVKEGKAADEEEDDDARESREAQPKMKSAARRSK